MEVLKDGVLAPTTKDSCPDTNIASTFMTGYHPDQVTKTITSGLLFTLLQFWSCVFELI